jgi:hypothetical protein
MFDSGIIEVAIGLIYIYLLLSLICSVLNEWVASILSLRASNLEDGIRTLLQGSTDKNGKQLAEGVYDHGLVNGLFKQDWLDRLFRRKGLPSYIPSRTFALALLDTIAPANSTNPQTIEDLRTAINSLPGSQAKDALLTLMNDAQNDLQKAKQNVEAWFNAEMDRVAGWYKRKSQLIILIFAIIVSAALNADTIVIVNNLLRDSALRSSVAAAAQDYIKNNPAPPTNTNSTPNPERAQQLETKLELLHVPLGWVKNVPNDSRQIIDDPRKFPENSLDWLHKIIGLLLTAIALSLGAPFWFDTLNKFIVVRSTIKPREKSHEESSKDK